MEGKEIIENLNDDESPTPVRPSSEEADITSIIFSLLKDKR